MATAGAWRWGLAWKAWAVITTPIHKTMAIPASRGMIALIREMVPVRQMAVITRPLRVE